LDMDVREAKTIPHGIANFGEETSVSGFNA
jgi:hypothetical protein